MKSHQVSHDNRWLPNKDLITLRQVLYLSLLAKNGINLSYPTTNKSTTEFLAYSRKKGQLFKGR